MSDDQKARCHNPLGAGEDEHTEDGANGGGGAAPQGDDHLTSVSKEMAQLLRHSPPAGGLLSFIASWAAAPAPAPSGELLAVATPPQYALCRDGWVRFCVAGEPGAKD
jgi:hypothetical protein